jgi:hypothetical protein
MSEHGGTQENFEQGRSVCIPATLKLTRVLSFNDTLEACCTLAITRLMVLIS